MGQILPKILERCSEIEKQNKLLLRKMTAIFNTHEKSPTHFGDNKFVRHSSRRRGEEKTVPSLNRHLRQVKCE